MYSYIYINIRTYMCACAHTHKHSSVNFSVTIILKITGAGPSADFSQRFERPTLCLTYSICS